MAATIAKIGADIPANAPLKLPALPATVEITLDKLDRTLNIGESAAVAANIPPTIKTSCGLTF